MSYVELLDHPDYEIMTEYPFTIRRTSDHYEISESVITGGYIQVNLNRIPYYKHRLIALQFIPNDDPEHKTQVDHRNKHRDDNHIENLRWVTPSGNSRNKSSYKGVASKYVDDIPDESILVDFYDTRTEHREFDDYFFYDDVFYQWNGINYRVLNICKNKSGNMYVNVRDINGKTVNVFYSKFKQQHDLT